MDSNYGRVKKVEPREGYDDIFIHGDKDGFAYKDLDGNESNVSPLELINLLNQYGSFEQDKIRLCACNAGAEGGMAAQSIANLTGKEVIAPNKTLWILPPNDEGICDMIIAGEDENGDMNPDDPGDWVTFYPRRRE